MSATSAARKPSTSRNNSTARCRGGRYCIAVTNANEIASRRSTRASGPGAASGTPSSSTSGYGCSQIGSTVRVGGGGGTPNTDALLGRRAPSRSAFRHRFVAIR